LLFKYCSEPLQVEVKVSTIHGLGLFAIESIPENAVILEEDKLFHHTVRCDRRSEDTVREAMNDLPPTELAMFNSLHGGSTHTRDPEALSTFITNAFTLKAPPNWESKGIYLVASRSNHSHNPNATFETSGVHEKMTFKAARDILKGEEITIAYCCIRKSTAALELVPFLCCCGACPMGNISKYDDVGVGKEGGCPCCWCRAHPKLVVTDWIEKELEEIDKIEDGGASEEEAQESQPGHINVLTDEIMLNNIMNLNRATLDGPIATNASSDDLDGSRDDDKEKGSDYEDIFFSDDDDDGEEEDGDYDEDDLGQLDVRPGLHSWLE
jgi:hypothetical protein